MKYIKKLFGRIPDQRIIDSISIRNIRNVFFFAVITSIFDVVSLTLFAVTNWAEPRFWHTFFNVTCCVVACALVIFLSRKMIRKYETEGTISYLLSNILVSFFYLLMSAWGVLVDVAHYRAGEQMLTFYIVQFCFLCFVVMQPKIGSLLIALSFSALYLWVYSIDGAAKMQPQNYFCFAIIAIFGNLIQRMMLQESEKSKLDILELNQILQQEASVDDLTQLKNRKALRNDFDKLIGKTAYIVMADVDHFKSYNDSYGHVMGDKVLCLVASTTMEVFRGGEAYRYGGDEFLILLSDCTADGFDKRMKEWQDAIRSIQIPNVTPSITCSYGYECRMIESTDDLRSAIIKADKCLYEAKSAR